jgi:hypothetical protein
MRRLLFRAEVGAESPLWDERGAMVSLDVLALPRDLRDALATWANVGWERGGEAGHEEGRRLYVQVADALVPIEVIWDNS